MPGRKKRSISQREKKWRYDVFVLIFLSAILMPLYYVVNYAFGLYSDITDLGAAVDGDHIFIKLADDSGFVVTFTSCHNQFPYP